MFSSFFEKLSNAKPSKQKNDIDSNAENISLELNSELLKSMLQEGWRQGAILSAKSSHLLYEGCAEDNSVLVIITQTCDLLHPSLKLEPTADLLVGEIRNGSVPRNSGKSFREFELTLDGTEASKHLYVTSRPRLEICRKTLFETAQRYEFQPDERSSVWFSRWLGEKYSRPAFPDSFDQKLADKKRKEKIAKAVKSLGNCKGLYMSLSSWEELHPPDTYSVSVMLLMSHNADESEKREAETAHGKICAILDDAGHTVDDDLSAVQLDSEITLRDFYYFHKWSLDYITIRNPDMHTDSADLRV